MFLMPLILCADFADALVKVRLCTACCILAEGPSEVRVKEGIDGVDPFAGDQKSGPLDSEVGGGINLVENKFVEFHEGGKARAAIRKHADVVFISFDSESVASF